MLIHRNFLGKEQNPRVERVWSVKADESEKAAQNPQIPCGSEALMLPARRETETQTCPVPGRQLRAQKILACKDDYPNQMSSSGK